MARSPAVGFSLILIVPLLLPLVPLALPGAEANAPLPPAPQPTFAMYPAPSAHGPGAAEPTLGVNWNTGNVMFQNFAKTLRVVFDDNFTPPRADWQNVKPPLSIINVDPILFTDATKGRTFAGGLDGECSILMYSDDDGQSWNPMANPCSSPSFDHQTIGSGPWKEPRPASARWDHAVYYCSQASVVQCARSDDGGITFGAGVPVTCGFVNPGLHGSVHVSADGNVYLPFKNGQNQICVARSQDNGVTWTALKMPGSVSPSNGFDPDVATTPSNWLYVGYPSGAAGGTSSVHVALSKNPSAASPTWTVSPDLGASFGLKVTTFHEMVAGDDERAAIAFLGTNSGTVSNAFTSASFTGVWHLYVAYTYDAGATWTTIRASDDPVQRGCIWDGGGSNACRNLLDFMDATVDEKGRVLVGFADGCMNACALAGGTVGQSRTDWATIARQTSGKGLIAAHDEGGPALLTVTAGGPYAGVVGGAVSILGTATGGSTPYNVQWSIDAAPTGSLAAVANPNSLATTIAPDLEGSYTLRLTVTDAAATVRSATATLVASPHVDGACGLAGVLIASDPGNDGGSAGPISEVLCVRVRDDASDLHIYVDLAGSAREGPAAGQTFWHDIWFQADYAANAEFLISVETTDAGTTAAYQTPNYVPIPGKVVTATWEDNTLHVTTPRSEILSPKDGEKISGVYVDANYCTGTPCTIVHADIAPDAQDGVYTLGSSTGSGGGLPLPRCSVTLATDPEGDTTATSGAGRRDLTRLSASDDSTHVTFCFTVRNFADAPAGAASATTRTRYGVGWTAAYEGPAIAYSARVVFNPDGTLQSTALLKGYAGSSAGLLANQNVAGSVEGDLVLLKVPKADIGNPRDGAQATEIFARVSDDGTGNGAIFDPVTGPAPFTFGQKLTDTTAPTKVPDLLVADLQTGSSLRLTWSPATDDTGVTSYVVRRATTAGGPYTDVATPTTTSYTDAGLTADTTYYYVVAAKDAAANVGANSDEASGIPTIPPPDTTPPTAPSSLVVSGTESDRISITWVASTDPESGVSSYNVWRDGAPAGETFTTTFTDVGLDPETTYTYEVSAVNGEGLESARVSIQATTLPLPPPDCGQTGFEVLTDPDFDSANGELRADMTRVSIHERDERIWFHVGTREMDGPQSPTKYRIVFTHDDTLYGVSASADDNGAAVWGVYTTVELPGGGWAAPRTSQDLVASVLCDSIIIGVRPADIGNAQTGAALSGLFVEATTNVSTNAVIHDRAPNAGGAQFVVGSSNIPPVLEPIGDRSVDEGSTIEFALAASDANGDPLTFAASGVPAGASFDETDGTFAWSPRYSDAAAFGITFSVSDGKVTVSETITLTVNDVDTTPVLQAIGDRTMNEGTTLGFTVLASDADGDAVTLAATNLPIGASFDPGTGVFSYAAPFTTGHADVVHAGIVFEATDGKTAASETIAITVADVNRAPVLAPIGNHAVPEGDLVSFTVSATDADGDAVVVTAQDVPAGATFDGSAFSWPTVIGDRGNHVVRFTASDGTLTDAEAITLSIGAVNRPPTVQPVDDLTVPEGGSVSLQIVASDLDGDALVYTATGLPAGATLGGSSGLLEWAPGFSAAGVYPIEITVSDGDLESTVAFAITVTQVDRAPVLGALAGLAVTETTTATRLATASDPDGDAVALTASGLPSWATFVDNGDGTGTLSATPPAYAEGAYEVGIRATSGTLEDVDTLTITVTRKMGLTVVRVGAPTVRTSPGEVVTLTATVTNTGSQTEFVDMLVGTPSGWTATADAPSASIEPGASTTVVVTLTAPENGGTAAVTLTARDADTPTVAASTSWIVTTPILLAVTYEKETFSASDEVRGTLRFTYLDGTPLANTAVTLRQSPRGLPVVGAALGSSVSGTTDETGAWAFSFGVQPTSRMLGPHDVTATLGGLAFAARGYTVG